MNVYHAIALPNRKSIRLARHIPLVYVYIYLRLNVVVVLCRDELNLVGVESVCVVWPLIYEWSTIDGFRIFRSWFICWKGMENGKSLGYESFT